MIRNAGQRGGRMLAAQRGQDATDDEGVLHFVMIVVGDAPAVLDGVGVAMDRVRVMHVGSKLVVRDEVSRVPVLVVVDVDLGILRIERPEVVDGTTVSTLALGGLAMGEKFGEIFSDFHTVKYSRLAGRLLGLEPMEDGVEGEDRDGDAGDRGHQLDDPELATGLPRFTDGLGGLVLAFDHLDAHFMVRDLLLQVALVLTPMEH